jgi:two-component system, NtrC family, sensor kinase
MRLSTKIILGASAIVVLVNLAVLPVINWRYEAQLREGLTEAARSYYKLIVVVRGWVSEHEGVFVQALPGVEPNPYLPTPVLRTMDGESLFWRNPALVTRELSELSRNMGNRVQFRVTSLDPTNPVNAPDDFETEALRVLSAGDRSKLTPWGELTRFEMVDGVQHFRYFAPLFGQDSCASCHTTNGYEAGAVRGGISILMPADHLAAATTRSYQFALFMGLLASAGVSLLIFLLIQRIVIRPLRGLEGVAQEIGRGNFETPLPDAMDDEIGDVSRALANMQNAIRTSVSRQVEAEKMSALGHLSAGIAHEIRNPLFAIRNDLDYLRRSHGADRRQEEVFQNMEDGVERISRTVAAVLGFARPHRPEHGVYTLGEVLERCKALLSKQMETERMKVTVEFDPDVPPLEMDIHQMEQVFVNLVTNAMRAKTGSKGLIRIGARREGEEVVVTVADDGRGIPAGDVGQIFEPFFTRCVDGTGLGLTIVRRIMEQHNGSVGVESEPGVGTTFTLRMPILQPQPVTHRELQPA